MYEMRSGAAGEMDLVEQRHARQRESAPDIRQYRGVYMTRLIIRILVFLTSGAIIFVLVRSLQEYESTKNVTQPFRNSSGSQPVWPSNLTLYPTWIYLGAALFAAILSLLLILGSFFKAVSDLPANLESPLTL